LIDKINSEDFRDVPPWTKLKNRGIEIGNFLMPLVYAGAIDRIVWIKPKWEEYSADVTEEFDVGNVEGTDSDFSSNSGNLLFGSRTHDHKLVNTTRVRLHVYGIDSSELVSLNFDPKTTLLDIDLDYFSTTNPAVTKLEQEFNIPTETVLRLARPYGFLNLCMKIEDMPSDLLEMYKLYDKPSYEQILKAHFLKRHLTRFFPTFTRSVSDELFLERSAAAQKYWCHENPKETFLFTKHFLDLAVLHKIENPDPETQEDPIVNDLLAYSALFPTEILNKTQIMFKMKEVQIFLKEKLSVVPRLTTIVMSESDGHTPSKLVDFLVETMYNTLGSVYLDP
jgi:hypothetical protein